MDSTAPRLRPHGSSALALALAALCVVTACDDGGGGDPATDTSAADTATSTDTGDTADGAADTAMPPSCGNGTVESGEACDGSALDGESCTTQGMGAGTLTCRADCGGFDTSGCAAAVSCGDDLIGGSELCDGIDLGEASCVSLGFDGGVLLCNAFCDGYETVACTGAMACGDDQLNPGEVCDGSALDDQTCSSQGFATGVLRCADDCQGFDTSACLDACGNNLVDVGEDCDGANLDGQSCVSRGFGGGALACTASCSFDETGCAPETCGNGMLDAGEACEGSDVGTETCVTMGFDGGTLVCASCQLDTSGCSECGNAMLEGAEACDGVDLGGETCTSQGFDSGELGCMPGCGALDFTGCEGGAARTPAAEGDVIITELMKNPSAVDDTLGEYIEVHNPSSAFTWNLRDCVIGSASNAGDTIDVDVLVAPGGYVTLAASDMPGFTPDYVYNRNDVQLGNSSDSASLSCVGTASLVLIDEVAYGTGFPNPIGASLNLAATAFDASANDLAASWCTATSLIAGSTDRGTPGLANDPCP